jgi:hypothetical protein
MRFKNKNIKEIYRYNVIVTKNKKDLVTINEKDENTNIFFLFSPPFSTC